MKKIPHFETVVGSTAWQMEQEAMAKGREEGIEKGREEGRQEAEYMLAMRLLNEGFSIPKVAELVGLPVAQVESLSAET